MAMSSTRIDSLESAVERVRAGRSLDLERLDELVADLRELANDVERIVGAIQSSLGTEHRLVSLLANGAGDAR